MKSGTALENSCGPVAWAPKQVEQALRVAVTEAVRMSGRPQPCAVAAPPESKPDIEPTAAKSCSHIFWYDCWSAPASVLESRLLSSSLRPQMLEVALK